jgi:hypothetical protein
LNPTITTKPIEARSWVVRCQRAIVMAVLYATPVFFVLRMDEVDDTDVWWHLRVGQWIAQHGTIPHTELFSTFASGKPWAAYSWLFELILFWLFQKLGLIGIVVYSSTMAVAIAAAVHHLVKRLNSDFTLGVGITFLAMYTMGRLFTPRPWLLTVLFFALELNILMRVRQTGKTRELLWLPVIFALWTNIHIQFVDGLLLLGIALTESVVARWWSAIKTNLTARTMVGIFLACVAATLLNPYGWTIYKVAYDLVQQAASLPQIMELSAISFRSLDDWCLLLIALAATAVLAKARRAMFFEMILLAVSIVISFRSQRDIWMLAIAGSAILSAGLAKHPEDDPVTLGFALPIAVSATVLYVLLAFVAIGVNNRQLQVKLENDLPVRAVEVMKQQGWGGPIYNDYNWGGFLIWSLNKPVSMYGRNTDFGVEKVIRSSETWDGYPGWDSDADLLKANLVIAQANSPLVQLLRFQPCLRMGYADQLAVVFITNTNAETATAATDFCTRRDKLSNQTTE